MKKLFLFLLVLIILVGSLLFVLRPSQKVEFALYENGKTDFSVVPNVRQHSAVFVIPEKRVSEEITEALRFDVLPEKYKINGAAVSLKENLVDFSTDISAYSIPFGFSVSFIPYYENKRVYLKPLSAKLGKISIPAKSTVQKFAKYIPEGRQIAYDKERGEIFVDLAPTVKTFNIKRFAVTEGKVEIEINPIF